MANIQINITENGTTTLATSGCICDRNIDINVDVVGGGGGYAPTDADLYYGEKSSTYNSGITLDYLFANNNNKWIIDNYGDRIVTENIGSANYMFYNYDGETIPFELNFYPKQTTYVCDRMFNGCHKIKQLPIVNNMKLGAFTNSLIDACWNIRKISMDTFVNADFSYYQSYQHGQQQSFIARCYSLREVDKEFLDNAMAITGRGTPSYTYWFQDCYSLDELKDLYVLNNKAITSNMFSSFANNCYRLKTFTFETDNGTPKVAEWKNQTIDLSKVGYTDSKYISSYITDYNSGCTDDDFVNSDEAYQALKDTDNWFAGYANYSRFNHDSAVETINSLPDCSAYIATAGGTNTIKFKGVAGSKTDGGAINTLTEDEIAVATAKGWTVTIV